MIFKIYIILLIKINIIFCCRINFLKLAIRTDCSLLSDQEPQDLYRHMEEVQMIDIQYYHHFMITNKDMEEQIQVRNIW